MTVALRSDSEAANGTASTSVVVTKPAGTADGDLLLAIISETGTGSITAPAGWTLLGSQAASTTVTSAAYYKVASSEGASWTWTLGASVRNTYWVGAFTGIDTSSPVYASSSAADTDGGLTVLTPAVDPVLIPWAGLVTSVAGVRTAGGSATTWTTSKYTEAADVSTNGGAGTDITCSVTADTPTGDYDLLIDDVGNSTWAATYTAAQSQSAVASWAVALRPAFTGYDGGLITGIVVEAGYGAAFDEGFGPMALTDISSDVREDDGVVIVRGRGPSANSATPSSLSFGLNNAGGQHTPLLPTGAHYPHVRRGLPFLVSVPYGYATPTSRGAGYASAIAPAWDESLRLATCRIQALGPLARLQKTPGDPRSALFRSTILAGGSGFVPSPTAPVAYWPLEDASGSRQFASATGGPAMSFSSATTVSVASDSTLAGSDSLPTLSMGAAWSGLVPPYTQTGAWSVGHVVNIPAAVAATSTLVEVVGSGTARRWVLEVTPGAPDTIHLRAYDAAGASLLDASASLTEADFYDGWSVASISVATNGTGVDYSAQVWAAYPSTTSATLSGTLASRTHGLAQTVRGKASASLDGAAIGHYAVYTDSTMTAAAVASQYYSAMTGHTGDLPYDRATRLCLQAGITLVASQTTQFLVEGVRMGPQPSGTLVSLLRECEDVAQALLHDAGWTFDQAPGSGQVGVLTWVSREDRYNAPSVMTLDFDAGEVEYYGPVLDDLMLRNDSTASDTDGGSARVIDQASADAEGGLYAEGRSYNLYDDTDAANIAGWRVNLGTVEQMRAPQIRINLRRNPGMLATFLYLKPGDKITLTNPPSQMAPDDIVLFVEGMVETLSVAEWRATLNCVAAEPYTVAVLDDATYGKLDTAGAELHAAATSTATTLEVATTAGPLWSTDNAQDGFDWRIAGERVTVTDIAPSAVTFVSAGTASSGSSGSRTPGLPGSMASGDLVLILASTRNSGTGVPDTPSGWTLLPVFEAASNVHLFGRIYDGVWSMPTVTYTGGAANEDTIAQSAAFRGMFHDVGNVVVEHASCLNASAQDITAPGLPITDLPADLVAIYMGWKADDCASVATPGSWTEIQEASSTAGSDASQVWGYRIFSSVPATGSLSPSIAVTGGGAAISRGAVVAIRCDYQTATVTRSVNGVVKAQSAGADVRLWTPWRWAL